MSRSDRNAQLEIALANDIEGVPRVEVGLGRNLGGNYRGFHRDKLSVGAGHVDGLERTVIAKQWACVTESQSRNTSRRRGEDRVHGYYQLYTVRDVRGSSNELPIRNLIDPVTVLSQYR